MFTFSQLLLNGLAEWESLNVRSGKFQTAYLLLTSHSKLRPNYPTPKIPKNCTSQDIKSGNSPRSGKVREGQKSGCFPGSKRENGQKPNGQEVTKMYLK